MTQEIIEMPEYLNASYEGDDLYTGDQVRELMKLVAAKEREACAEIGDTALYQLQETMNELGEHEYMERCVVQGAMNQAAKFTKAIRARGEA